MNKVTPFDIVLSPVVTEKSSLNMEHNRFTFLVSPQSTKPMIKNAIEKIFDTKVESVSVLNRKGKVKRFRGHFGKQKRTKRAFVRLCDGHSIDIDSMI